MAEAGLQTPSTNSTTGLSNIAQPQGKMWFRCLGPLADVEKWPWLSTAIINKVYPPPFEYKNGFLGLVACKDRYSNFKKIARRNASNIQLSGKTSKKFTDPLPTSLPVGTGQLSPRSTPPREPQRLALDPSSTCRLQ